VVPFIKSRLVHGDDLTKTSVIRYSQTDMYGTIAGKAEYEATGAPAIVRVVLDHLAVLYDMVYFGRRNVPFRESFGGVNGEPDCAALHIDHPS
jgi:CMP-2-keto-3-deoxyoctulosonic acid synthetase